MDTNERNAPATLNAETLTSSTETPPPLEYTPDGRLKSSKVPGPNNRWTGIMEIDEPERFALLNIPPYDRHDPANTQAFLKSSFTDCYTLEEWHHEMEQQDRDARAGRYAFSSLDYANDAEAKVAHEKFWNDIEARAEQRAAERLAKEGQHDRTGLHRQSRKRHR